MRALLFPGLLSLRPYHLAPGRFRLDGFQAMTSHQGTLFLRGRRLCLPPQRLQLHKIDVCRRRMDDEQSGGRCAGTAEGMRDTTWHEGPKPGPPNATLGPHHEFDRPLQHIKALRPLMPMRWWSAVADRERAFHEAEGTACGVRDCLEEHRAPPST